MKTDLVLCPRDGLTLKDARGFDRAGGVTAGGLPWPGPATVAGSARAVIGRLRSLSEVFGKDKDKWQAVVDQVDVRGPIVLARPLDGDTWEPLWPAPQDALRLPNPRAGRPGEPEGRIHWLEPRPRDAAPWRTRGLWDGDPAEVGATEGVWLPRLDQPAKPLPHRLLWSGDAMLDWLRRPQEREERDGPQPQERIDIHLQMDPDTLAAKDEALFAHSTYEPLVRIRGDKAIHELAIGLRVEAPDEEIDPTAPFWRIGGEGRFASAGPLPAVALGVPDGLLRNWDESRYLRLVLATPARFETGWRPDWLEAKPHEDSYRFEGNLPRLGRPVTLRAAFLDRAWWTSGWDLANRCPKPSVACVAAGSVYYIESLAESFTTDEIRSLWLGSIQGEKDPMARDGFGLMLPGAWPVSA